MSKYKPYPKYKKSGVEWLGDVPEGWVVLNIKRLCFIKRGASPRPIENPIYFDHNGEYAWVRISDVTLSDMYLEKTTQKLSTLGKSLSVPLEPNDLFLSIAGSVGKPIIANIKCCIHDGFVYFQNYRENLKFLYWIFKSGQPYLGLGKFGTQLNLNKDTVGDIKIGLPSLTEQNQIVRYLEAKTQKIDTLIEKQQTLIKLLKEKRQAVISDAVTKGLDGSVSTNWKIIQLKYIIKNIESGTSVNAMGFPASTNDYGVLNTSCIFTGHFRYKENKTVIEKEKRRVTCPLKQGTLIVSRMNTPELVGIAGIVNYAPSNIFLPDRLWQVSFINTNTAFIHYITLTDIYRNYIKSVCTGTSASMQNLSQSNFKEFQILLPPLKEQKAIANYLDQKTKQIDTLITKSTKAIELLKERRTALISAVVTGKIDVQNA